MTIHKKTQELALMILKLPTKRIFFLLLKNTTKDELHDLWNKKKIDKYV